MDTSGAYVLVRSLEDFLVGAWGIVGLFWDFVGLRYYGPTAKMVVFSMILAACFLVIALIAQERYQKYVIAAYVVSTVTLIFAKIMAWVRPSSLLASTSQVASSTTSEDWPLLLWGIVAIAVILALMVLPYVLDKITSIGFFSMIAMFIFLLVAAGVDVVMFSWPASVLSGLLIALATIFWFAIYTIKQMLREPGIKPPGMR